MRLCTVGIEYVDGETDSYLVPLTVLDGDRARVVRTLPARGGGGRPGRRPARSSTPSQDETSVVDAGAADDACGARGATADRREPAGAAHRPATARRAQRAAILSVEQSNSSVVIDDQVMVKLLRRLQNGENLELEVDAATCARSATTTAPRCSAR